MYEHNALGFWSGLALCLTKVRSSRARCPATALIISLYLLNIMMDQVDKCIMLDIGLKLMDRVDTLHVGRHWSEELCCTITTHLVDLEFKVTNLEILC